MYEGYTSCFSDLSAHAGRCYGCGEIGFALARRESRQPRCMGGVVSSELHFWARVASTCHCVWGVSSYAFVRTFDSRDDRVAGREVAQVAHILVPGQSCRAYRCDHIVSLGHSGKGLKPRYRVPLTIILGSELGLSIVIDPADGVHGRSYELPILSLGGFAKLESSPRTDFPATQDAPTKPVGHGAGATKYAFTKPDIRTAGSGK